MRAHLKWRVDGIFGVCLQRAIEESWLASRPIPPGAYMIALRVIWQKVCSLPSDATASPRFRKVGHRTQQPVVLCLIKAFYAEVSVRAQWSSANLEK